MDKICQLKEIQTDCSNKRKLAKIGLKSNDPYRSQCTLTGYMRRRMKRENVEYILEKKFDKLMYLSDNLLF